MCITKHLASDSLCHYLNILHKTWMHGPAFPDPNSLLSLNICILIDAQVM